MGFMTNVLRNQTPIVNDAADARDFDELHVSDGPSSLEFRNVSLQYQQTDSSGRSVNVPLLSNVSFKIERGQNVAIVGPSGSGNALNIPK